MVRDFNIHSRWVIHEIGAVELAVTSFEPLIVLAFVQWTTYCTKKNLRFREKPFLQTLISRIKTKANKSLSIICLQLN